MCLVGRETLLYCYYPITFKIVFRHFCFLLSYALVQTKYGKWYGIVVTTELGM